MTTLIRNSVVEADCKNDTRVYYITSVLGYVIAVRLYCWSSFVKWFDNREQDTQKIVHA